MRYCLVAPKVIKDHYENNPFAVTSHINWAKALGGDVKTMNEDLSEYDVLHISVTNTELEYPNIARALYPDAKIVVNLDFSIGILGQYFTRLTRLKEIMKSADHIFSVDWRQAKWLEFMLGRSVKVLPHPADIDAVKVFKVSPEQRSERVAVMHHAYEDNQLLALEIVRSAGIDVDLIGIKAGLCTRRGHKFVTERIMNAEGYDLDYKALKKMCRIGKGGWDSVGHYLKSVLYYSHLTTYKYALDFYTLPVLGRYQIDCAILGIPCVSTDYPLNAGLLFPRISFSPYHPVQFRYALQRLSSENYYEEIVDEAEAAVQYYSLENSAKRFKEMMDEPDR